MNGRTLCQKLNQIRQLRRPDRDEFIAELKADNREVKFDDGAIKDIEHSDETGGRLIRLDRIELWARHCSLTLSEFFELFEEIERKETDASAAEMINIAVIKKHRGTHKRLENILRLGGKPADKAVSDIGFIYEAVRAPRLIAVDDKAVKGEVVGGANDDKNEGQDGRQNRKKYAGRQRL